MYSRTDGHLSATPTSEVIRTTLANGLEVLVEPMHHAPVVALQTWVRVGAADENKARAAGLAHLHEHMLFKGTQKRGVGEVARTIEAVGGEMNAWTSFDETVYHLVLGKEHAGLGLELLHDMLSASVFDPQELAREIEVVLEEIRRAEDAPMRRMSNALFDLAYQSHAYRHPVLGTRQSVAATRREDMLTFFQEHYRPDNVTLLIVGDIDAERAHQMAEEAFGGWQPAPPVDASRSTRAARTPEPKSTQTRLRMLAEDVPEARLSIAWPGLGAADADTAALDVFSVLLGHGDSSRLHQALVRPRKLLDTYASCYTPKDAGLLLVGATLNDSKPAAADVLQVTAQMLEEAYRLVQRPPGRVELDKARTIILSEAAYSRETMEGQARKRGFYHLAAGGWQHEAEYTQAVRTLQPRDVSRVAQRILAQAPVVVMQLPKDSPADTLALTAEDFSAALRHAQQHVRPLMRANQATTLSAPGALGVHRVALPQGPTLLLLPQPGPVVSMRAIALAGQRLETVEQAGLGALYASCLGQASVSFSAEELAAELAALGAGMHAFSGRNSVGLAADATHNKLDETLGLSLEALLAPVFAEEDVARERHAQSERIRSRADSPGGTAVDLFLKTLFERHPYGRSPLGEAQSLERLGVTDVEQYHSRYMAPDRMVLALVGPFDPQKVLAHIEGALTAYGSATPASMQEALLRASAGRAPAREAPPSSPRQARQKMDKQQAHVLIGSQGTTVQSKDRFALDVLSSVLSGQSGRLFADLRDAQSLAYSLSCSSAEGLDPGHVVVHMACSFEKVERAVSGVRGHLQRMCEEPLHLQELARAQNMLIGAHAIDLQRAGSRAMALVTGELYKMGYDSFTQHQAGIKAVTAEDVMRVAQQYLAPQRLVEVIVGPG